MTKAVLYHCLDARSLRCLWAAEETGMDIDLRVLPFPPRAFAPEYRAVNPLMTVPGWLENGQLLTESAAICQRIVMGSDFEVRPDEPDYFACLNWLHRSDATLTFPLAIMLRYTQVEQGERRLAQAVEDYKAFFLGRAKSVEAALADGRHWLVADRFTVADICIGYALFLATTLGIGDDLGPLTQAYRDRLIARPAFLRARERQRR